MRGRRNGDGEHAEVGCLGGFFSFVALSKSLCNRGSAVPRTNGIIAFFLLHSTFLSNTLNGTVAK